MQLSPRRRGRPAAVIALAAGVLAAGCGDGDAGPTSATAVSTSTSSSTTSVRSRREEQVADARDAAKEDGSVAAYSDLAAKYLALASPTSGQAVPEDRQDNLERAVDAYEQALELAPRDVDVLAAYGSTLMAAGQVEKSVPVLKQVAETRRTDPNAYFAWGLAAGSVGDRAGARAAYTRYVALAPAADPRVAQARRALRSLG